MTLTSMAERTPRRARQGEETQEGAADRAEVVHHPLKPIRLPINMLRDNVGKKCVPSRHSKAARGPGGGAENTDLPDAGRHADQR